jgi:hypothetical protein
VCDDQRLLAYLIGAIVLCVGFVTSCTAVDNYVDNSAIVQMVQAGADPLAAKAAIRGCPEGGLCTVLALRAQKP